MDDHADYSFLLFIFNYSYFSPSKDNTACQGPDASVHTMTEICVLTFKKLCVHLVLLNISQSLWIWVHEPHLHSHSQPINISVCSTTCQSMKRMAKKRCSFTNCVVSGSRGSPTVGDACGYLQRPCRLFITCTCKPSSAVISQSSLFNIRRINDSFIELILKQTKGFTIEDKMKRLLTQGNSELNVNTRMMNNYLTLNLKTRL